MVQGNVIVPPGAWCDMIDSRSRAASLVSGGGLRIAGSAIGGSLVASASAAPATR